MHPSMAGKAFGSKRVVYLENWRREKTPVLLAGVCRSLFASLPIYQPESTIALSQLLSTCRGAFVLRLVVSRNTQEKEKLPHGIPVFFEQLGDIVVAIYTNDCNNFRPLLLQSDLKRFESHLTLQNG